MKKKLFSLALALALCLGLTVPAFAAELKIIEVPVPTVEEYEGKNYSTMEFHEGLSKLYVSEGSSTTAGFIDKTGKVVIPAKYSNAGDFSEGFAFVAKNGKLGFIDKTGKEITPFQYDSTLGFHGGFAAVVKNGKAGFIDKTGKEVISFAYDDTKGFYDGLAAVKKSGKWGFIDKTGEEAIPFQYDEATSFFEGLAGVKKGGKWGFIDKTGEAVIDFQYDDAGTFAYGLATVRQGGRYGYIDKTGEIVIPCQYDVAGYFSDGLAMVAQNGKFGYIDTTGKTIVPLKYTNAAPFSEGFAAVYAYLGGDDGNWGFIDTTGKEVVEPIMRAENGAKYAYLQGIAFTPISFHDGYAYVSRWFSGENKQDWVYLAITVDANVSDWARAQVDSAAASGLMPDGLGDDFTAKITRAEFAALAVKLYEAMGGYEDPAIENNPFSDTSDPVVLRANALGIVKGSGGQFRPDDLVSREEAAGMLSRVYTKLGGEVPTVTATTFADDSRVSSWAKSEVAFMADKGIITGKGNNTFDPNGATGNASIQEAMVIALRMFEKLK